MSHDIRAPHGSATPFAYPLAIVAALALVTASGGFGGYFAWTANRDHAPALACFAVVMALGLEIAKPLAVHALFDAVRAWRFGQALALGALATVAVGYSLNAELQLMARSRADAIAERQHGTTTASDIRAKRDALQAQLGKIAAARTVGELEPLIAVKTAATKGHDRDTWLENAKLRAACLHLAPLKAEAARAAQRADIAAKIEAAETAMAGSGPVKVADPSAIALATYLARSVCMSNRRGLATGWCWSRCSRLKLVRCSQSCWLRHAYRTPNATPRRMFQRNAQPHWSETPLGTLKRPRIGARNALRRRRMKHRNRAFRNMGASWLLRTIRRNACWRCCMNGVAKCSVPSAPLARRWAFRLHRPTACFTTWRRRDKLQSSRRGTGRG